MILFQPQMGEIAIEASQIISRLEQVAVGNAPDSVSQPTVFLGLEQKKSDEIMQVIQGLMSVDEEGEPNTLPALDDIAKLVLVTHSLAAYCGALDRQISQKLSARFAVDTARWLTQLFGYVNNTFAFYKTFPCFLTSTADFSTRDSVLFNINNK